MNRNEDIGVWVAFNHDGSAFVVFPTEIQAYRYASGLHMSVKFARFGDPDWMNRDGDGFMA